MKRRNIAIETGGTGGHTYPALSIYKDLHERKHLNVYAFLTDRGKEFGFLYIDTIPINAVSLPRDDKFKSIIAILKVILYTFVSIKHILKYKIGYVISFGGYTSVPMSLAAFLLRSKLIIHEANILPGIANKFLSKLTPYVAIGFMESKLDGTVCTTPIRDEFFKDYDILKLKDEIFKEFNISDEYKDSNIILIFGGSQGAESINKNVAENIDLFKEHSILIFHIIGRSTNDTLIESDNYIKINFYEDIYKLYKISTFIISRGGGSTCMELIISSKPSLLLPYKVGNLEQVYNIDYLYRIGCTYSNQKQFLNKELIGQIIKFMNNKLSYKIMEDNLRKLKLFYKNKSLSDYILDIIEKDK